VNGGKLRGSGLHVTECEMGRERERERSIKIGRMKMGLLCLTRASFFKTNDRSSESDGSR
jgi:hypothetical protein